MKKLFLILVFVTFANNVMALGIGVYGNYNGGKAFFRSIDKPYNWVKSIDKSYYSNSAGGGVILEFASISSESVDFSYRLKIGCDKVYSSKKAEGAYRVDIGNFLYFKIFRNKIFSLLLGPQIGINYLEFKKNIPYLNYTTVSYGGPATFHFTYNKEEIKIKSVGINAGLSLSMDFNITDNFIFFIQLGGEQNFYFSKIKDVCSRIIINPPVGMPPVMIFNPNDKKLYKNYSTEGSVSVGFMYKV